MSKMLCFESAGCTHTLIFNFVTAQVERKLAVLLALIYGWRNRDPEADLLQNNGNLPLLSFFAL